MVYWISNTALECVMGKKKDERKRREREAEMAAQGHSGAGHDGHERHAHDGHKHEGFKHVGKTPFAGLAATLVKQLETPVGRQIIAAGLMAAATAISKHDAKSSARPTPPTPPTPPAPPSPASTSTQAEPAASKAEPDVVAEPAKPHGTGPFAGDTPEPPRSETNALPPEFVKVLDSVTVGLERLFVGFGKPTAKKDPPAA
jgi:hypothetical protein